MQRTAGTLPLQLGRISDLELLHLSSAAISGTLPAELFTALGPTPVELVVRRVFLFHAAGGVRPRAGRARPYSQLFYSQLFYSQLGPALVELDLSLTLLSGSLPASISLPPTVFPL